MPPTNEATTINHAIAALQSALQIETTDRKAFRARLQEARSLLKGLSGSDGGTNPETDILKDSVPLG